MAFSGSYANATVTNPSSSLTDFSLLVDLSRLPQSWWDDVDTSDATKGRASKGDGTTELAVDWLDFDNTAETGWARINWVGTLSSTGTQIVRIYPPKSENTSYAATATYGQYNAYDDDWNGYWTLDDSNYDDRTSNQNSGTLTGTDSSVAAKVGDGRDLGNNSWIEVTSLPQIRDSQITIMAWGRKTSFSGSESLFGSSNIGTFGQWEVTLRTVDGTPQFVLNSFDTNDRVSGSSSFPTNAWTHLCGVYDGTDLIIYQDATNEGSVTPTGSWDRLNSAWLGGFGDNNNEWNGDLDEVQLHSTGRSADWVKQEYDQTDDQATFWGTWSYNSASAQESIVIVWVD